MASSPSFGVLVSGLAALAAPQSMVARGDGVRHGACEDKPPRLQRPGRKPDERGGGDLQGA